MADHPILFSAPMVQALLRECRAPGTGKTQTRRIAKKAEVRDCGSEELEDLELRGFEAIEQEDGRYLIWNPPHEVGDRLWVRETWQSGNSLDGPQLTYRATPDYFAIDAWDGPDEGAGPSFNYDRCPGAKFDHWLSDIIADDGPWRVSIHMPRWASRITLHVAEVRIEPLNKISKEDAAAEGLAILSKDDGRTWKYGIPDSDGWPGIVDFGWPWDQWHVDPVVAYARLWDRINGDGAWRQNPWVIATTFKPVLANIDDEERAALSAPHPEPVEGRNQGDPNV